MAHWVHVAAIKKPVPPATGGLVCGVEQKITERFHALGLALTFREGLELIRRERLHIQHLHGILVGGGPVAIDNFFLAKATDHELPSENRETQISSPPSA